MKSTFQLPSVCVAHKRQSHWRGLSAQAEGFLYSLERLKSFCEVASMAQDFALVLLEKLERYKIKKKGE